MPDEPSLWHKFSPINKVLFWVYYFLSCIVPIILILVFVNISHLPEVLLSSVPYGMLFFCIVTFIFLESRIEPLLQRPVRLFFPLFIQACFLIYGFSLDKKEGINSVVIFALSQFLGLLFGLFVVCISYIYKKPLARKEHFQDKIIKIFFGLFITMFIWAPALTYGYAYVSSVMVSHSGMVVYVSILQFLTGVISEVISQKEIMKNNPSGDI